MGFQKAGYNIVAAFEKWKPAVEVYKKNFKHCAHEYDLTEGNARNIVKKYEPNIIIGGPPCQDFSTAGLRDEKLGRAALTIVFAEIVSDVSPQFFVMENVPSARKSSVYAHAIDIFRKSGFGLTEKILDASYCGVPQTRKRLFLIGNKGAKDNFLDLYLERNLSATPMTIYEYLGDSLGVEYYFRVPTNYKRRGVYSIYEPALTIRCIDRPIPKGYKGHPNDPVEIGPKVRALTIIERSYIQTFPKDFVFEGTKSDLNQMIGNAVPVRLAEYIARAISEYTDDIEKGGVPI